VLSFVKEVVRMPITVRLEKELVENFPVIGDLVKQGIQEGLQQGIQQGLQQGLQQGKNEGLIEGKQEDLIKILEFKFSEVEESLKKRIKSIRNAEKLNSLLIKAIQANSVEEFKQEIAED